MLNRRHLRIKVLQILYAFYQSNETDVVKAQKDVLFTVERMYDMYIYLLLTLTEIKRSAENKIEERKKKLRPTPEDLSPNFKLVPLLFDPYSLLTHISTPGRSPFLHENLQQRSGCAPRGGLSLLHERAL